MATMNSIRAVFFDAVGTLLHPEPAAALMYADAGRRFGSHYSPETIARRFLRSFQKQEALDRASGWITSEQRELERWRDIVGEVLDDVADPGGCFAVLHDHFAQPESWRCEPEAEALFEDLRARGYELGLASNFDSRLSGLVEGLRPLHPLRGQLVASFDVGFRKPAPEFFQALCRRTGLAAANILHVGDDPHNDYAGAEAAGLAAVLYDPFGKNADWPGTRISTLGEVRKILNLRYWQ
jgi:putative hydrolase of the HAD superfamily